MWIPVARLTAEHNIDDLLVSMKAACQSELWRKYVHQGCARDFVTIPHQGIEFVCTSEEARQYLGGVTLKVGNTLVTIRKYSRFDKLYFVVLQRLPFNGTDRDLYTWLVVRKARPILITATQDHGMLKSRARTVYFNSVNCPAALFEPCGGLLREIFFVPDGNPCFVQHRFHKHNRARPPSLRPALRPPSDVSDANSSPGSAPLDSSSYSPPSDKSQRSTPVRSSFDSVRQDPAASRLSRSRAHTLIPGSIPADAPDWKVVQHSQYGILSSTSNKFLEPGDPVPCEQSLDATDPMALRYAMPVLPNDYEALTADGYDTALPPGIDISVGETEDGDEIHGFTADTSLYAMAELRAQKKARWMPLKAGQVTVAELDIIITEFIEKDALTFTSLEDVLATIQDQPAYFH
ncbi:hypothetical protein JG687_00006166 [Phytophthora cactorum]|uniref:Uncharacterized protein n=1 Tax=Phytophthora cactorum TaxID=29920 RepID=A0A8T1UIX0_9STRA|nr:hypothetical protein JG687_00006166 [Phytophthora cactorum]